MAMPLTGTHIPPIHHEKQRLQLCACHALNCLFQDPNAFNQASLDELSYQLAQTSFLNPHRSLLGLGNYDVNVLMLAVQQKGCEMSWFDKRRSPKDIDLRKVTGFILNVPCKPFLGLVTLPWERNHWLAVKYVQGFYYNLDSKLNGPEKIGGLQELCAFYSEKLIQNQNEKRMFLTDANEPMEGDTVSYVIYTATAQNGADLRPVKAPLGFDVLRLARLEGTRTNNQILQNTFKIDQTNTTNSPLPTASDNSLSVSLSEQFKWGAVVCVGVFIIVFACVLTAYWVHKKQQEFMRSRIEDLERRRAGLISPFTISRSDNSSLQGIDNAALQLPPPYLEVRLI
nr:EOG090X0HOM [Lepidurus arcticus]